MCSLTEKANKLQKPIEQVTKLSLEIISKVNVPTSVSQTEPSHSRPQTGENDLLWLL